MNISLLIENAKGLRKERLFLDRVNPLEAFSLIDIKTLFRFERRNLLLLVDELTPVLEHEIQESFNQSKYTGLC